MSVKEVGRHTPGKSHGTKRATKELAKLEMNQQLQELHTNALYHIGSLMRLIDTCRNLYPNVPAFKFLVDSDSYKAAYKAMMLDARTLPPVDQQLVSALEAADKTIAQYRAEFNPPRPDWLEAIQLALRAALKAAKGGQ